VTSGAAAESPDARRDRPSAPRRARRRLSRRWVRWALFLLLPLALIVLAVWYVTGGRVIGVDDAYVGADKVGVSTDVSGTVVAVEVTDNQRVAAGQVLFRLDDLPFRLALQRAEGAVGAMRNDLAAQKASYRDIQAQVTQARNDVSYYATEYARQHDLMLAHVASQAAEDTARRNLQAARQKLASLVEQRAAMAARLNGDPTGAVETNPRYLEAKAARDEAARQLAHTVVKAPFAGVATNVPSIAPGRYLPASTTAFYIVSDTHVWVDAVPKETQLTWVRIGQPATVRIDAYPNTTWRGVVQSISPAAAQEFSLLPAQNTSGNWVKVVQRIPLRVRVDTSDRDLPPLRAGMSATVRIDTGHSRGIPGLDAPRRAAPPRRR
jgi:membrane fusion protein (multidrug efflux system)